MRTIEISTEVFAKIWSHRIDGEEDENTILSRLLGLSAKTAAAQKVTVGTESLPALGSSVRWRDDVKAALRSLGGKAQLRAIYQEVISLRRSEGRTIPVNADAIIRRELETNSSDSSAHTGRHDWFRSVGGIGRGVWAVREGVD